MLSSVTTAQKEGISLIKHPSDDKEFEISVIYKDGTAYRQQILSSAPINGSELIQQLSSNGIKRCSVVNAPCEVPFVVSVIKPELSGGIISFNVSDTPPGGVEQTIKVTLFADYTIRKVPDFISSMTGFTETVDLNNDTLNDYKMIYANGEEQYFFLISAYFLPPLTCIYSVCVRNKTD